jgi:endonuclease III
MHKISRIEVQRQKKSLSAEDLGIDLHVRSEKNLFKWFLACLFFGKPIQQSVAARAYREFVKENLVSAESVLNAGWDKLVTVLDRGHYVRYDFSTATKLLKVCQMLKKKYGASVKSIIESAKGRRDLVRRLEEFYGVGPMTSGIFVRELFRKNIKK